MASNLRRDAMRWLHQREVRTQRREQREARPIQGPGEAVSLPPEAERGPPGGGGPAAGGGADSPGRRPARENKPAPAGWQTEERDREREAWESRTTRTCGGCTTRFTGELQQKTLSKGARVWYNPEGTAPPGGRDKEGFLNERTKQGSQPPLHGAAGTDYHETAAHRRGHRAGDRGGDPGRLRPVPGRARPVGERRRQAGL